MQPKRLAASVLLLSALVLGCGRNTPLPKLGPFLAELTGKHHFDHVLVIVLENQDAAQVDRVAYMDSLARTGVALSNYYAVAHPSYPNYLAMVAGKTFIDDARARPDPDAYSRREFGDAQMLIDAPTIADRLQSAKLTWDVFAEDYPVVDSVPRRCDFRSSAGLYARKHVPFLSFKEFRDHADWCAHVRNLKWLRPDSLAAYTFIAPNLVHDGHDAPLSSAVTWLRGFLAPILADSVVMKSTLIVVTFDEASNSLRRSLTRSWQPNVVYTVLLGGMAKAGTSSDDPYNHFSLLRTVETNFGLSPSLLSADVSPIEGVWR